MMSLPLPLDARYPVCCHRRNAVVKEMLVTFSVILALFIMNVRPLHRPGEDFLR
jgi:hypothetical protein